LPNIPVRANARALPKTAPKRAAAPSVDELNAAFPEPKPAADAAAAEPDSPRNLFDRAYARWLRARAALDDQDVGHTDEEGGARLNEVNDAALALLVTPVFRDDMLWRKWEVLEHFVSEDAEAGHATDNRAIMALGCIKADMMRLGIGDGLWRRYDRCPTPSFDRRRSARPSPADRRRGEGLIAGAGTCNGAAFGPPFLLELTVGKPSSC
jgi:hypothetical protein